jgi:hypothetical protein
VKLGRESAKSDGQEAMVEAKEERKGMYESEERAPVEIQERLRFPYPAYSDVVFGKK